MTRRLWLEGRDAAGKGGTINRITQRLNPRVSPQLHSPSVEPTALRASRTRPDTAHGLPRHYVPRKDDFICVTASAARQSMQPEVMDYFTSFAMTKSVHGKEFEHPTIMRPPRVHNDDDVCLPVPNEILVPEIH